MAEDRGDATGREIDPQATGAWNRNGSREVGVGVLDPPAADVDAEMAAADETGPGLGTSTTEPGDPSSFAAELAGAMREVVERERVRLVEYAERQREAHLARVHAADTASEQLLRQAADENSQAIEAWVAAETARLERDAEGRRARIREDLETGLASHRTTFDAAVERVESAIAAFRSEVDRYFGELEGETDVVRIASQATRRPAFPVLDIPGMSETGVSPEQAEAFSTAEPAASEAAAVSEPVLESGSAATPEAEPSEREPAAEPAARNGILPEERASGSLLQAVPVLRPMTTWLRRDDAAADEDDPATPDRPR